MTRPDVVLVDPPPVVVVRDVSTVTVAAAGMQGPKGDPGAQGPPGAAGGAAHIHLQAEPAATWVIDHDLGRKVHTSIFDPDGRLVFADVDHATPDQTTITFAVPAAGSAILS